MDQQYDVFLSVGATATEEQEKFVSAIEDRLRSAGLIPHTVGRSDFSSDSPLTLVRELMDRCCATVVVALERMYFEKGLDKPGGPKQSALNNVRLATPWNQVEAAMAYSRNHPLLVIVENGIKSEGLLERGYEWYVLWVDKDVPSLNTKEFNGVFSNWKDKVAQSASKAKTYKYDENVPVTTLLGSLNPRQLWGALTVLAALLAGSFALGNLLHTSLDRGGGAAAVQSRP